MKSKIKYPLFIMSAILLCFFSAPVSVYANDNIMPPPYQYENSSSLVVVNASSTGWRYTNIDGKAYKRLYNYSAQKWIGDWIAC